METHKIKKRDISGLNDAPIRLKTGESVIIQIIDDSTVVDSIRLENSLFRFNSTFALPESIPENKKKISGIELFASIIANTINHPEKRLLIVGHTDTVGSDEANLTLSNYRGAAIYSIIFGNRELFQLITDGPHLKTKEKKNEVMMEDHKQVLNWVAASFSWPCSMKENHNDLVTAIRKFQESYNAKGVDIAVQPQTIDVDGDFGPQTYGAIFDCYMYQLAKTLGCGVVELSVLQKQVHFAMEDMPYTGVGEKMPIEKSGQNNVNSQLNRRVEVHFFDIKNGPVLESVSSSCSSEKFSSDELKQFTPKLLEPKLARSSATTSKSLAAGSGKTTSADSNVDQIEISKYLPRDAIAGESWVDPEWPSGIVGQIFFATGSSVLSFDDIALLDRLASAYIPVFNSPTQPSVEFRYNGFADHRTFSQEGGNTALSQNRSDTVMQRLHTNWDAIDHCGSKAHVQKMYSKYFCESRGFGVHPGSPSSGISSEQLKHYRRVDILGLPATFKPGRKTPPPGIPLSRRFSFQMLGGANADIDIPKIKVPKSVGLGFEVMIFEVKDLDNARKAYFSFRGFQLGIGIPFFGVNDDSKILEKYTSKPITLEDIAGFASHGNIQAQLIVGPGLDGFSLHGPWHNAGADSIILEFAEGFNGSGIGVGLSEAIGGFHLEGKIKKY